MAGGLNVALQEGIHDIRYIFYVCSGRRQPAIHILRPKPGNFPHAFFYLCFYQLFRIFSRLLPQLFIFRLHRFPDTV